MIVVAKNLSVLQLFISRMPKMCAILQLVSAFVTAVQFTKVSISSKYHTIHKTIIGILFSQQRFIDIKIPLAET